MLGSNDVSSVILGTSKVSQLEENLKCVELKKRITKETWDKIEEILGNRPCSAENHRSGFGVKKPPRR